MEFQNAQQISAESLQSVDYDLFILGSGYEKRCTYLLKKYAIKAEVKLALAFEEKTKELNRRQNDSFLLKNGFQFIEVSGEKGFDFLEYLSDAYKKKGNKHLYILVDYSSMTKVWYSAIINGLIRHVDNIEYVTVHFSYTPALYNMPKKASPGRTINYVSYPYEKPNTPDKPVVLIIGLGLNGSRANFILKEVNPFKTYLAYADPAKELKYVENVFKYNHALIEKTEIRNLVNYPLHDLEKTDATLTNLCLNLREKYNIVIAPMGPKVFSLLSLLLASRYPDIKVLRVSSGPDTPAFERIPDGEPYVYSVDFVSEEIEF